MTLKWLRTGSLATLDQAWLSAINLAISIAFIRHGDKSEYGLYVLLLSPIYFIQGIQNALFLSPFGTLYPQSDSDNRYAVVEFFVVGQVLFGLAAALIGILVLLFYQWHLDAIVLPTALAFGVAVIGVLARESSRTFQYSNGNAGYALVSDLVFGAFVLTALGFSIYFGHVTALTALAATGIAGAIPLLRFAITIRTIKWRLRAKEVAAFGAYGRWALIGVGITWINLNMYPYIAANSFGVDAVAEINAARLFMMPLVLGLPAWSNLFRPKFSRWFAKNDAQSMRITSVRFSIAWALVVVGYSTLIYSCYPWLGSLLGPSYSGILPLIIAWTAYFLISSIRTVLMANLMVDEAGYKALSKLSFMALFAFVPSMVIATHFSAVWVIGALSITELLELVAVAYQINSYWKGHKRV